MREERTRTTRTTRMTRTTRRGQRRGTEDRTEDRTEDVAQTVREASSIDRRTGRPNRLTGNSLRCNSRLITSYRSPCSKHGLPSNMMALIISRCAVTGG